MNTLSLTPAGVRSLCDRDTIIPSLPRTKPGLLDLWAKSAIGIAAIGAVGAALSHGFRPAIAWFAACHTSGRIGWLWDVFAALSAFYLLSTFYFAFRYRPIASVRDAELPTCTVIVPAYNEGEMVRVALISALQSRYPTDKLRVIAVDDGSTDDTWEHLQAVARAHPGRVHAIRMERNSGKREALRVGFLRADSEMLITVDSDSKVEPDAIRNIVAPMLQDREVCAVAGKVLVLNRYANLFTRMLAARFFVTFDLARAAQSRFGAVLCTPGALSAYRREAVMKVLDAWSTQTFMGAPCTIAEDRALTTWLLRSGHRSVYQSNAVVHTVVPTTSNGIARTFVRWERGNIREDFVMLPVLFRKWRTRDRWWPTFDIVFEVIQYPLAYVATAVGLGYLVRHPACFVDLLAGVIVISLAQSLYARRSERGTDFVYGIGYSLVAIIGLQWVFPYSLVTVRNGRWLTR